MNDVDLLSCHDGTLKNRKVFNLTRNFQFMSVTTGVSCVRVSCVCGVSCAGVGVSCAGVVCVGGVVCRVGVLCAGVVCGVRVSCACMRVGGCVRVCGWGCHGGCRV